MHATSTELAKQIVKFAVSIAESEKQAPNARHVFLAMWRLRYLDAIIEIDSSSLDLVEFTFDSDFTGSSPLLLVVEVAVSSLRKLGHSKLDAPHLFIAMLDLNEPVVVSFCDMLRLQTEELRGKFEAQMRSDGFPFYQAIETYWEDGKIREYQEIERNVWSSLIESIEKGNSTTTERLKLMLDQNRNKLVDRLRELWGSQPEDGN